MRIGNREAIRARGKITLDLEGEGSAALEIDLDLRSPHTEFAIEPQYDEVKTWFSERPITTQASTRYVLDLHEPPLRAEPFPDAIGGSSWKLHVPPDARVDFIVVRTWQEAKSMGGVFDRRLNCEVQPETDARFISTTASPSAVHGLRIGSVLWTMQARDDNRPRALALAEALRVGQAKP